jgi:outer membrane protein TolC
VNADTLERTQEMLKNAQVADKAGLSVTAGDINRAYAEYEERLQQRRQLEGQLGQVSAHLAHILLLRPTVVLRPADPQIVPITLVSDVCNVDQLVVTALSNRPEVREGQAFSAAAMARLREARLAPLMPHVDVTYYAGEFGGGVNSQMGDFGSRGDGEVDVYWQLKNLGAGDAALAHEREAQFSETNFQLAEIRAQIGEDVTAAYRQVEANRRSLEVAEQAVKQAFETWRRLKLASFGMVGQSKLYDPLQPLIAERDLDQARTAYLNAVIGYNKAEFQLFWAMGQPPMQAPLVARPSSTSVPVVPVPHSEEVPPPDQALPQR